MARKPSIEIKIGDVFGQRTVLNIYTVPQKRGTKRICTCRCICGTISEVDASCLRAGHSMMCEQCRRKKAGEFMSRTGPDHPGYINGHHSDPLYKRWQQIKQRCFNPKDARFAHYGAMGITMCDEWKNNYDAFKEWSLSHGFRPELVIDRIDTYGSYCPENCRWITPAENTRNTKTNVYYTIDGVTKCVSEWAHDYNQEPTMIFSRLNRGWDILDALQTPPDSPYRRTSSHWRNYTINGETKTLAEWARHYDICVASLRYRVFKKGEPIEVAIEHFTGHPPN